MKNILEKKGLLARQRLERNLITATNGKIIELDREQVELIYQVAYPDNIDKNVVIQGPEGSGKTLLGMEIVKLIANNRVYTQNLTPPQSKKDIRLIFSACHNDNQPNEVNLWKKQIQKIVDRDDLKSLYEVKVEIIGTKMEETPQAYNNENNLILELLRRNNNFGEYEKTIIMIDELNPCFETSHWRVYDDFNCSGVKNVQIVFNIKYDFHDLKIRMKLNKNDAREYVDIDTQLYENVLVGRLRKAHRCSNQIRNFVYYLLMHDFDNGNLHKFKSFDHDEPSFDSEMKPIWIDLPHWESFIASLQHNRDRESQSLFEKPEETVLIYDPDTIDSTVKSECDNRGWKYVSKTEAVGIEFSTVIIYGLKEFHFEAFTRAVNQLIIVTTSRYV